ncbi:S1C family serine protease [Specibacter sp. RAF43]|uniref:S1C family serine protease n=1 Tax=Specibacter sp. RAF43 TaxID=3233057 RepID=UPI003F95CF4C
MSENIGGNTNRNQDDPVEAPRARELPADEPASDPTAQHAPEEASRIAETQRIEAPGTPVGPGHVGPLETQHTPYGHAGPGYPASNTYPHMLAPAVTTPPKERRKVGMGLFAASVLAAALIGGGAAAGTSALLHSQDSGIVASSAAQNAPIVVNNKNSVNAVTAAAAKAMPSVVTISATSGNAGGTGSGIVLDTAGHILTNTHVVTLDGAAAHASIEVQTSNGKVYKGTIVGTDPLSDLAIVKIDAPNLTPADLGNSDKINVGDTVIAIGSPLGLNGTVTDGIVSTLNRTIQVASSAVPVTPNDSSQGQGQGDGGNGFQFSPPGGLQGSQAAATGTVNLNVIQTDAAINPGNSGGALVNSDGQIIGVNVAIASTGSSSSSTSQGGNIGVGFSIPIDHAQRVAQEIIKNGKASHGQLGVSVGGTSANGQGSAFSTGATVASVTGGSAAAKAGLAKGDVITQLGERTIGDPSALTAAVREQAGGATVKLTFLRDGKTHQVDVTLDTMPAGN